LSFVWSISFEKKKKTNALSFGAKACTQHKGNKTNKKKPLNYKL
jgi:hypothetical protein